MALESGSDQRFRTKQEYVYQSLRGAIMRGELPPASGWSSTRSAAGSR